MKAAIYRGQHNIKIEEISEPEVKAGKMLLHFKAGSICGTDMHFYRGDWQWMKRGLLRFALSWKNSRRRCRRLITRLSGRLKSS